jgi:hypothetical protein
VQHILEVLEHKTDANKIKFASLFDWVTTDTNEQERELEHLKSILDDDVIGRVRTLVSECRVSGQRREALTQWIVTGNTDGAFKDGTGAVFAVPVLQLLRDVATRWSSTYLMIDRLLELYPVCRTISFTWFYLV